MGPKEYKTRLKDSFLRTRHFYLSRLFFKFLLLLDGLVEIVRANFYFQSTEIVRDDLYPDFLGIGAQKSATSWLDKTLRIHPQLCLPAGRKELHFFDHNYWKGWNWYLWHFRYGKERIRGEITPAYSILDENELLRIKPRELDIKIILILRNPLERAWSMACMDLVKQPQRNFSDVNEEEFLRHIERKGSLERGSYCRIVSQWKGLVGSENLFIGYYDDILEDAPAFMERLFKFLGADPELFDWSSSVMQERENTTGYPMPDSIRCGLIRLYADEIESLDRMLDDPHTASWKNELTRHRNA